MVQANLIQSEYNDRGINATVGLSDLVVSDLEFWGRRDALAKDIFLSSQTSQLQDQYLSFVLKNRKSLYEKWFSKKDGETEQDWSLRIKQEVIPKSLADYLLLGQIYEEKNLPHIGLDCSSSVTCGVYEKRLFSQQGYAVIHGRTSSSEVSGYEGD